jgi:WD40 repeat protein
MRKIIVVYGLLFFVILTTIIGYSALNADPNAPKTIADKGPVLCVAVSRDGKRVVSGHRDSRARVWNVDSGELIAEFGQGRPSIVCASFSPDGHQIAFAHADEFVRLYDLDLGRETKTFRGHTGTLRTVSYMPNGKQVLSAGGDKTIRLWDVATGSEVINFVGHGADVNAAVAFDEGRKVISASGDYWGGRVNDSSVRIWDAKTGKELRKFTGEFAPMKNLVLSPDERTALTCSWDTGIQVWDMSQAKEIRRFGDKYTECIALSPDGRQVVSGAYGNSKAEINLWSVESGELLLHGPAHERTIYGIAFFPDGVHVVACSGDWGSRRGNRKTDFLGEPIGEAIDCTLRLWDIKRGVEVRRFNRAIKP